MMDKKNYEQMPIPEELDEVVQGAINEGLTRRRRHGAASILKRAGSIAAVLALCAVAMLNLSPAFASAACELPVVGGLCRVFLFREYHAQDEIKYVDAQIPQIENTGKTELEARVNLEIQKVVSACLEESEARARDYYDAFIQTGGAPEDFLPMGITVDYEIHHISPQYVSFTVREYETAFRVYNQYFYYNLDLDTGRDLTLRDWFGNDYRQIVADSMEQTLAGWSEERRAMLWDDLSLIELISENTDFYLNQDGQAVVVIERYKAACGAAGQLEFVIETPGQPSPQ